MPTKEQSWDEQADEIGRSAWECIRDMVAALECDYDRLEALLDAANPDNAEELAELEEAAGDCECRDEAAQRIADDPLSVEVRSDWGSPGEPLEPCEYRILLSTGGPATQITGDLDEHGEPRTARLQVQDWFQPWTEYLGADAAVLLTYAREFIFVA